MLALVLAHRHVVRAVEQDVRGLEHRVGEQTHGGPLGAALGRLVLELGHPARLAEPGEAREDPLRCACAGTCDWTKTEDRAGSIPIAISWAAARRVRSRSRFGVLLDGDRVQVGDEEERLVVGLEVHPLPQRAEVVAEVERVGGRLDPGEDPGTGGRCRCGLGHGRHSVRRDRHSARLVRVDLGLRLAGRVGGLRAQHHGRGYDGHQHARDPAPSTSRTTSRWSSKSTVSPASGTRPSRAMMKPARVS